MPFGVSLNTAFTSPPFAISETNYPFNPEPAMTVTEMQEINQKLYSALHLMVGLFGEQRTKGHTEQFVIEKGEAALDFATDENGKLKPFGT